MSKQLTIRVTDATLISGVHQPVGSIHTLDEVEALVIIGAGRAEIHVPVAVPARAEVAEAPPATEHASAEPAPAEKKARVSKAK